MSHRDKPKICRFFKQTPTFGLSVNFIPFTLVKPVQALPKISIPEQQQHQNTGKTGGKQINNLNKQLFYN